MKIVGKYDNPFAANIAKGMLKEAGIEAYVLNENLGIITGIANSDLLAIQLVVDDSDFAEAERLLATSRASE